MFYLRLLLIFISSLAFSCNFQKEKQDFSKIKKKYTQKIKQYLAKDQEVSQYVSLNDTALLIYDLPQSNPQRKIEFVLTWENAPKYAEILSHNPHQAQAFYLANKSFEEIEIKKWESKSMAQNPTNQVLEGFKIALDPGHIAGDLETARMEGRMIDIHWQGEKYTFFESKLVWFTAKILAQKLENLGAEVLLTRNDYSLTALDISFEDWYKQYVANQKSRGQKPLPESYAFAKELKKKDFEARVEKINDFNPDLTMILHYNVDATNVRWKKPTQKNNSMAFVGGSIMQGELGKKKRRFHFLRLLLTKNIENSIVFSSKILESLENKLNIPIIPPKNQQSYLPKNCLQTDEKGVYARNLSLTREIFSTLCYIEPLYQDNAKELLFLNEKNLNFMGEKLPQRIDAVADSYFQGILVYLGNR